MSEHETKAHILARATAVFAEKGFAKASMNDIVGASGLSKGGVYWHFKSKAAIINAIFDQFFNGQLALLDDVLAGEGTAVSKLKKLAAFTGEGVEALAAQFPTPLEFYALAAREDRLQTSLQTHFQSYQEKIGQLIAQGVAAGEFHSHRAKESTLTIMALFEGILLIWALAPEQVDLGTQVETAVSLLLNGLQTKDSQ